jgi:hypothetical protein
MSTAHGTLDRAAASPDSLARQALAGVSGQQPGGSSCYVGVHRRGDGHGLNPDYAQRQLGYRPRHRQAADQPSAAPGLISDGPLATRQVLLLDVKEALVDEFVDAEGT